MNISVVILTLDEEINLRACLESVRWSDDVVVLDSGSHDATVAIARELGARVEHRAFDDYGRQRSYALNGIEYRNDWVLMLDADERVPEDLAGEMLVAVGTVAADVTLMRMRRKDHLFGRWIRGSSGYPTWFGRLMKRGHVRIERAINEEYLTDGVVRELSAHLHHLPFNKGFAAWIDKHDRYSSMEAALRLANSAQDVKARELFDSDPIRRRRAQKALAYRLPGRPLLMFLALYLLRGGIFEGRAGFTFSALRAWYEYMIDCKLFELQRRGRGLPV
jgi:glycosyltransferase involved in cell wall biosynthesis